MVTVRPKVGDVFVIPLSDDRAGVGQIVGTYDKDAYYFAIFDSVLPVEEANEGAVDVSAAHVLFLALSLDAKLHAGHWTIVGQAPVSEGVPLPAYKEAVGLPPRFDVVDCTGTRRRPATPAEADTLPNRKVVAPVRLERALKAALGLEPWLETFDELKVDGIVTTADAFG